MLTSACAIFAQAPKGYAYSPNLMVRYAIDTLMFSSTQAEDYDNMYVEELDTLEYQRTTNIIDYSLKKYPNSVLASYLKRLYVFKRLTFYGVGYGGTYSLDLKNIFVTNNGYYFKDICGIIHHEFSSILLRCHIDFFDAEGWEDNNESEYLDFLVKEALEANLNAFVYDSTSNKKGFLFQYSQTSLENDFNSFAQEIMQGEPEFWEIVRKYPRIREKTKIFLKFYYAIDKGFKELIEIPEWFKVDE